VKRILKHERLKRRACGEESMRRGEHAERRACGEESMRRGAVPH